MLAATVFAALSLLLVASTVATLAPRLLGPRGEPYLALVGMFVEWFIPQLVLIGIGISLFFVTLGVLATPVGWVALGAHLLAWMSLGVYFTRLHFARPLLDGTVVSDGAAPFSAHPEHREVHLRDAFVFIRPMLLPVDVTKDVVFREVGGVRLKLDVYRPRRRPGALPVVLYVHGGGWVVGSRRQSRFMMYELAHAGFTVFAISYRLAPRFPLPSALEDVKAALAWVKRNAPDWDGDPERITVVGGSAGGHLAAMLALTPNDPRFQQGFEAEDTRVSGAVILYGAADLTSWLEDQRRVGLRLYLERLVFQRRFADDPEHFRTFEPMRYARPDAPPILFVHGELDCLVPIDISRRFVDSLRQSGAPHVHLLEVPHAHHAFELLPTPTHQRAVRVIADFLRWVAARAA